MRNPLVPMDLLTLRGLHYLEEASDGIADHPVFLLVRLSRAIGRLGRRRHQLSRDHGKVSVPLVPATRPSLPV